MSDTSEPASVWMEDCLAVLFLLCICLAPTLVLVAVGSNPGKATPFLVGALAAVLIVVPALWRYRGWRLRMWKAVGERSDPAGSLVGVFSSGSVLPTSIFSGNFFYPFEGGRGAIGLSLRGRTLEVWAYDDKTPRRVISVGPDVEGVSDFAAEKRGRALRLVWTDTGGAWSLLILPVRPTGLVRRQLSPKAAAGFFDALGRAMRSTGPSSPSSLTPH